MAEKKARQYDNIIDEILDQREPDWKGLDMEAEKDSGEEQQDRTHQYVDKDFMDEIAESASRHTPVWGPKSATPLEQRLEEKEAAAPRINAVAADRKVGNRWMEDFKSKDGDDASLFNEVTESIDKAYGANNLAENSAEKKAISDAQVQKYVRDLLNQGVSPAKVAKQLEKLAEIELFNHQSATDYLQRNAGLLGLAYLEPNTFMDKNSPKYERKASKTALHRNDEPPMETPQFCPICGTAWEDDQVHFDEEGNVRHEFAQEMEQAFQAQREADMAEAQGYAQSLEEDAALAEQMHQGSNDCVNQKKAWDSQGIKPQAKSVKQVKACEDCTYFKKDASGKACNLYHLPVVANTTELTQIVNNLTPGVPSKQKHAALVQIANGEGKRAAMATEILSQTNLIKTADAKVKNQAKRASNEFGDYRESTAGFTSDHVAKMHTKGASLQQIYKWATEKFGDFETSYAFRGFSQTLKKNASGKIVLADNDAKFLRSIGIRNEAYVGAAKCASCPAHFNREAREQEQDRGAQRVAQKFVESSSHIAASKQEQGDELTITAKHVRALHQAGHSVQKIYNGVANKVGSVQAKKIVAGFIEDFKKNPGKLPVNASDRAFLEGKLGFKPEQIRMLNPDRRPVTQVVASVPDDVNVLAYPGMEKQAGEKKHVDGHSILAEFDLAGNAPMEDIDVSGPKREDIQVNATYKVDLD